MLLALLGAVTLFLVYKLLLAPMNHYVDEQQVQLDAMQQSFQRVKSLAAQVKQLGAPGTDNRSNNSLAQQVDLSLRKNGLTLQGLQSGANGEVRLRLQEVEYARLLQWLHDMEIQSGVQVVSLSIVAGKDVGRVVANIRLKKGG